jgi:hypothetical protein
MYCDEALESVEAVAAGELIAEGRIADHYASCPNCAAALEGARRLEQLLQRRPVPQPPPQFTARTMARVRRVRWRSEQFLDVGFNIAMGMIALGLVFGAWMALNRSGLVAVSNDALELFSRGLLIFAQRVAPSLPLYLAATAIIATALAIWWWAERDMTL